MMVHNERKDKMLSQKRSCAACSNEFLGE